MDQTMAANTPAISEELIRQLTSKAAGIAFWTFYRKAGYDALLSKSDVSDGHWRVF